jgi:hypothetical protein
MLPVLRHDALGAELAGMREDGRAVALQVLAILDPGRRLGEELRESGLALLKRPRAPVLAVELEEIEGIEAAYLKGEAAPRSWPWRPLLAGWLPPLEKGI